MPYRNKIRQMVAAMPLFEGLCPEELAEIERNIHLRTLPVGTLLLSSDHLASFIYLVVSGSLKFKSLRLDGSETTIALLGPGEVLGDTVDDFGNDGFLVEATETATLLWMSREIFMELLRSIPLLSYNFSQILSRRLSSTTRYLQLAGRLDVNGRVAYRLLSYAKLYGRPGERSAEVVIPMRITQSDLAQLIGASRVSVNQTLSTFKQLGYLRVDKSRLLVLCDQEALARLCHA